MGLKGLRLAREHTLGEGGEAATEEKVRELVLVVLAVCLLNSPDEGDGECPFGDWWLAAAGRLQTSSVHQLSMRRDSVLQ